MLLSNDHINEMRRGKYNSYMPKERAKIGQYVAMHGATTYVVQQGFYIF